MIKVMMGKEQKIQGSANVLLPFPLRTRLVDFLKFILKYRSFLYKISIYSDLV